LQKKVLILPLLDALSPITGGVGGGLTLRATSNKKLLVPLSRGREPMRRNREVRGGVAKKTRAAEKRCAGCVVGLK